MVFDFKCIEGCADCCIWRDYYSAPNSIALDPRTGKYSSAYEYLLGKLGVEILASEVHKIKKLVKALSVRRDEVGDIIEYRIYPCTAVTPKDQKTPPSYPDTFQIMGRTIDGDICPFLSAPSDKAQPKTCIIYEDRPLMCRAYPIQTLYATGKVEDRAKKLVELHKGCQTVVNAILSGSESLKEPIEISETKNLDISAIIRLQSGKDCNRAQTTLWRWATGIYNQQDKAKDRGLRGWVNWSWF